MLDESECILAAAAFVPQLSSMNFIGREKGTRILESVKEEKQSQQNIFYRIYCHYLRLITKYYHFALIVLNL